jgi:hypothetical protein
MSDAAAPAPELSIDDLLARVTAEAASTNDPPAATAADDVTWHIRFYPQVGLYQKANEYHMQILFRALSKMEETNEGERTLLDNSMIVFCSSLFDGNAHDSRQLPVLLAGGGAGTIRGGRLLDYSKDPNRKLCRLHMALMDRMGVHMDRFGDAETALSDLG